MVAPGLCVRHDEAMGAMDDPTLHHGAGEFRMKLQAPGMLAVTDRLIAVEVTLGEQFASMRQVEPFAVEVIDHLRPAHEQAAVLGWTDRIPADLDQTVPVGGDLSAKIADHHLCAETDAEERLLLLQRNGDPVDFIANELVRIVCAHRPAEDDGSGVSGQRLWKRVAERRSADVERITFLEQHLADPARARALLMEDEQDRCLLP